MDGSSTKTYVVKTRRVAGWQTHSITDRRAGGKKRGCMAL